jgi:hypothetical protein
MTSPYTKVNFDFNDIKGLISPRKQLHLEGVAIGLIGLSSEEGYTFTHMHREQEEVYIVIEGDGVIQLDKNLLEIEKGDVIRVASYVRRALKAGTDGLKVICAGGIPMGYPKNPHARYLIDDGIPFYDDVPAWYEGKCEVLEKNMELKKRMGKKRQSG